MAVSKVTLLDVSKVTITCIEVSIVTIQALNIMVKVWSVTPSVPHDQFRRLCISEASYFRTNACWWFLVGYRSRKLKEAKRRYITSKEERYAGKYRRIFGDNMELCPLLTTYATA